jgi:hypothetical protein
MTALDVTVKVSDLEPVKQILAGAQELAERVAWVLNDAVYTAPEDHDRHRRQFGVLRDALGDFRAVVLAQTDEPAAASR